mgnify:CR=1 FL=1
MNQDHSNAAEDYVNRTAAQLQRSFKNTLIVAVIILALESIYFTVLNIKIAEGLTAIPALVEAYRGDFDMIKGLAGKIPDNAVYQDKLTELEGYLDRINEGGPELDKIAQIEAYLDQINDGGPQLDKIIEMEGVLDILLGEINEQGNEIEGMANLISQKIVYELDYQGHMLTSTASDYLKQNIDELPEWVKNQIPKYGTRLRFETSNWINQYCMAASEELGTTFDAFLDGNADKIKEFSERIDDEETLDKLDDVLTDELVKFLEATSIEKYGTLKEQSDKFLKRLEAANELLRPLATKKTEDLSKQQLRLRTAVALFMDKVNNPGDENN